MSVVELGDRRIGAGAPCLVIAEAGVNHDGERSVALELVDAAARAGADAVKFQTFEPAALASRSAGLAAYQRADEPAGGGQLAMLERLALGAADFEAVAERCRERGILFLSTPFDERSAALLERLGVVAFKVASGELTNLPFLAALARRGLPLLVSTGMATLAEVRAAVAAAAAAPLALLHCVSSYPAPPEQSNLRAIDTLARELGVPVGLSDHAEGFEVSLAAVARGATLLERHLTLDRSRPGPDHAMSLEPDELGQLVRKVRVVESALGDGVKAPQACELDTLAVARRSIVAARALAAGEILSDGALALKRPGDGLSPAALDRVLGARLERPLERDEQLTEAHLEGRPPRPEPARPASATRNGGSKLKVAAVTGGRADYGLLRPTLLALEADPRFELALVVAGMHLDEAHGLTVHEVEAELPVAARVPTGPSGDYARALAAGTVGFADALERLRPDLLLVLGDRHEALAAALAATGAGVPIAHVHGGELSEGSLDDANRHCITKLSHIHLVATSEYAQRVVQLGEDPSRVRVVGATGLEAIRAGGFLDEPALASSLGLDAVARPLLALTYHPASLASASAAAEVRELIVAVDEVCDGERTVIASLPNDDPGAAPIREELLAWAQRAPGVHVVAALGPRYLSLLAHADAALGNSSSGLIEAPALGLPVVNVGERQRGRIRPAGVLDAAAERSAIAAALRRALAPGFRAGLDPAATAPYGDGHVSERVLAALAAAPPASLLRDKRFGDLPDGPWRGLLNGVRS